MTPTIDSINSLTQPRKAGFRHPGQPNNFTGLYWGFNGINVEYTTIHESYILVV
jgi:hypothetical protein